MCPSTRASFQCTCRVRSRPANLENKASHNSSWSTFMAVLEWKHSPITSCTEYSVLLATREQEVSRVTASHEGHHASRIQASRVQQCACVEMQRLKNGTCAPGKRTSFNKTRTSLTALEWTTQQNAAAVNTSRKLFMTTRTGNFRVTAFHQ